MADEKLLKPYDPKTNEEKIYKIWTDSGFFNPDTCIEKKVTKASAPHFSITLPPPNVTGTLHIGHAAMLAIEDIMVRFNRMRGNRTLWIPGTDHAAIATQSKVEELFYKKEKKTRFDFGREEFLKHVNKFAQDSHDTITNQIKKMGASVDWSREAYTLDEKRNHAVNTAFKKMYDDGLIYQGFRIVNWDPKLKTTVSDDEIDYIEETSPFYYLKYGPFTIATSRPETKFGDKYVVMHPDDKRYFEYKDGQKIKLEWINGPITATIIKDNSIDMEFGTGVMTITPWHDKVDFDIAEKHGLDKEQIIDFNGTLLPIAGEFSGIHIKKARPLIIEKLKSKGLIEKIEDNYKHNIAINSRGGGIIEPQIKKQWFVAVNKKFKISLSKIDGIKSGQEVTLKELMTHVVKNGQIKIIPEHFEKIYFHWIDNLRDWCISRQIWFGHRIPVWYKTEVGSEKEAVHFEKKVLYTKLGMKNDHEFNSFSDDLLLEKNEKISWFSSNPDIIQIHQHYINILKEKELISDNWVESNKLNKTKRKSEIYCDITPPKEPGWMQDEDTLDTWFSSGLWTFSTLGWPDDSKDLKNYHPTTVLETGYDILFFWVARMILMSTYLLGEIPFQTVYLHGLIRDAKGRKMSKSLGNIIDPLVMIDKFGADATRLSLIIGTGPGSDSKMSEEKGKAYKHFANKIWNAARFVITNTEDLKERSVENLQENDKLIKKEFDAKISEITSLIENYRFYLAGEKIYEYFWHTFADIIIEESKPALFKSENEAIKTSKQNILFYILENSLKILHPFMPFITEEIWSLLPERKNLLIIEPWPNK